MSAVAIIDAFGRSSGVFDFMNTAWAWPLAESLHFIGLSLLLGTIGVVDLRLLGFAKAIPLISLHTLTRSGIAGFVINALTGSAFFVSAPDQYLYNPAFQLKLLCMLMAFSMLLRSMCSPGRAFERAMVRCRSLHAVVDSFL
jgi:hypothetical protein